MREECGFIADDGEFYRTKKEAESADAKHKLSLVQNRLNMFHHEVGEYLFKVQCDTAPYRHSMYSEINRIEKSIYERVSKMVLERSDDFIAVIKRKEEIKKELDILKAESEGKGFQAWYLKHKWW